jgi:hypothetical protein
MPSLYDTYKPFAALADSMPHNRAGVTPDGYLASDDHGIAYHYAQGTREQCEAYVGAMQEDYPRNPYLTAQHGELVDLGGGLFRVCVTRAASAD